MKVFHLQVPPFAKLSSRCISTLALHPLLRSSHTLTSPPDVPCCLLFLFSSIPLRNPPQPARPTRRPGQHGINAVGQEAQGESVTRARRQTERT
eukprot:747231-Hanusia_phi.AAC.2